MNKITINGRPAIYWGRERFEDGEPYMIIHGLYLPEDLRGCGFAGSLIRCAIAQIRCMDEDIPIRIIAGAIAPGIDNDRLCRFYQRLGFVRVGQNELGEEFEYRGVL